MNDQKAYGRKDFSRNWQEQRDKDRDRDRQSRQNGRENYKGHNHEGSGYRRDRFENDYGTSPGSRNHGSGNRGNRDFHGDRNRRDERSWRGERQADNRRGTGESSSGERRRNNRERDWRERDGFSRGGRDFSDTRRGQRGHDKPRRDFSRFDDQSNRDGERGRFRKDRFEHSRKPESSDYAGRAERLERSGRMRRERDFERGENRREDRYSYSPRNGREQAGRHPNRRHSDHERTGGGRKFAKHWDKPHYGEYRSDDPNEPIIPAGISAADLDAEAQKSLLTLSGANQEIVARHLVMAGEVIDSDPELAYQHAQAAVKRAGRVDIVREAAALTAYASGRFEEALREVRATRRMRGGENLRAIEADCERGLGRPQKALQIVEETDTSQLSLAEQTELVLVGAGARADLGQHDLALLIVNDALDKLSAETDEEAIELNTESTARLMSYKADLLYELGREAEAKAVESAIPELDEPMEIIDLGAIRDADVDRVRSELRGTGEALVQIYDGLLLDLDGVCYQGNRAIQGAAEALKEARDAGVSVAFVTNNASRSAAQVVEKLRALEFEAEEAEIMTSAMDVMSLVTEKVAPGEKILVVGSDSLKELVAEAGYQVVSENEGNIAAVIQGFDPAVSWRELSEAAFALQAGARFYATNLDKTLPIEAGNALGNGALTGAVTLATGRRPEAAGKPHASIYLKAIEKARAEKPLAVGDRLDTDIVGAINAKIPSLHVLTGVHQAREVARAEAGARPSFVALDVSGVLESHPVPRHHRDGTWTAGVSQIVFVNKHGNAVIDDIELEPKGLPVTISLDTYRALLAASWEFADQNPNRAVKLPVIHVVSNDDPSGQVTETNFVPETPAESTESAESVGLVESTETIESTGLAESAESLASLAAAEATEAVERGESTELAEGTKLVISVESTSKEAVETEAIFAEPISEKPARKDADLESLESSESAEKPDDK